MASEIQLISDGDGLAVIGDSGAVDRLIKAQGLQTRDLGLPRLQTALTASSGFAQAGSEVAAHAGRWVKLTEESARKLATSEMMTGSKEIFSRAVFVDDKGTITGLAEIVKPGLSWASNPAVLAGAAGLMAQLAMQQTMNEITEYLAVIEVKVNEVLRSQRDAVLADMIGVDFVIEEAMAIREQVGRVSEVTWSKVQGTATTVAQTQAYALRQLDGLADDLESKRLGDLAEAAKTAELKTQEWLAVLARCFQLQDAIAVLELDRVLDASPDELDQHRLGLRTARDNRSALIAETVERLMMRMNAASGTANAKVLLQPGNARSILKSGHHVCDAVIEFEDRLGIEEQRQSIEARRWAEAATEARDKAVTAGVDGLGAVRRRGVQTFGKAKVGLNRFSTGASARLSRRDAETDDE
ncbi:hypothetical protein [Bogoriella caseilytica]|uniref:Uncharacterized protein n=1 Tax=Bogoriella caseilytica TaxID=56055 RepID=A0A3N2BAT2_9MICO|nr:hypothetical protein [Bogoriella caseilytica]ROR72369.1 hypothetical protein EDD31_0720 [Bogoriella caseilytica]